MNNNNLNNEIWKLLFFSFFLSFSVSLLPPFGIFISSLTPLPLILIYFLFGKRAAMLITWILAVALSILSGFQFGLLFFIQYGLMALIIGEANRRGFTVEKTIIAGTLGPIAVGGLILMAYWTNSGSDFIGIVEKIMQDNINNSLKMYTEMGIEPEKAALLKREIENISKLLVSSIPSILVIGSFTGVLMNFLMARFIAVRRYGLKLGEGITFKSWILPDIFVWMLIGSGGMIMFPVNLSNIIGLNCLVIILALYLLQGIAVVISLMAKWKAPLFLKVVFSLIVLFQPIFLFLITGLGLFDLWIDFRKIRTDKEIHTNQNS